MKEAPTAKEFYETNQTIVVNVPRPNHPEDKSGWDGVRRASEARFIAKDALVMPLWDVFDFAEKYAKAFRPSTPVAALSELVDKITPENLHPEQGRETPDDGMSAVCDNCGLPRYDHSREAFDYTKLQDNSANVTWKWGNEACPVGPQPFHAENTFRAGVAASESTSKEK